MMGQIDLEDILARARRSDPSTSKQAAERGDGIAKDHARRIVEWLGANGPATKDGIAAGLSLDPVQVARRMRDLERAGLVRDTGQTAPLKTGRKGILWGAA